MKLRPGASAYLSVLIYLCILTAASAVDKGEGINRHEGCRESEKTINRLLSLGNKADLMQAAELAVKIPPGESCGAVHYRLMDSLISAAYYPEVYNTFIIEDMKTIDNPSMDYRTSWYLKYISSDGIIDRKEWESGLKLAQRAKTISLPVYFGYIFAGISRLPAEESEKRIDEVMKVSDKFGYDGPLSPADIIFSMVKGLDNGKFIRYHLILSLLNRYSMQLPDSPEYSRDTALIYSRLYTNLIDTDSDRPLAEKTISSLTDFLGKRSPGEGAARILIDTGLSIERKIRHTRDPFYERHLSLINGRLKNWICFSLTSSNYINSINRRKGYAERNRVSCGNGGGGG